MGVPQPSSIAALSIQSHEIGTRRGAHELSCSQILAPQVVVWASLIALVIRFLVLVTASHFEQESGKTYERFMFGWCIQLPIHEPYHENVVQ